MADLETVSTEDLIQQALSEGLLSVSDIDTDTLLSIANKQGLTGSSVQAPSPQLPTSPMEIPEPPSVLEQISQTIRPAVRPTLEALGSIGGGVVGAPGGPLGVVAGGGLGFAAGREIADIILGEQTPDLGEELVEAGENVIEGAALEATGAIGGQILTRTGKALFKPTAKFAKEQFKRLQAARELDIPVTIGEATGSAFPQKSEGFFRRLLLPSGKFQKFDQVRFEGLLKARDKLIKDVSRGVKREASLEALGTQIQKEVDGVLAGKVQAKGRVLNKFRDDFLELFGSSESFEQLGRTTKELIEGRQRDLEKVATAFFTKAKTVLPRLGEEAVDTTNMLRKINKTIAEESKALPGVRNQRVLNMLSELKSSLELVPERAARAGFAPGGVAALPSGVVKKPISFNSLIKTRSSLNDIIGGLETQVGLPGEQQLIISGKKVSRLFKGIKAALDDDLAQFAKQTGTNVDEFIKAGLETSKRKFDFVKAPAIKQLMRTQPDQILDIVLKPRQIGLIKLLKEEFTEQQIKPLQQATTNRLLGIDADEVFTGTGLKSRIKKFGQGTVRELLGDESFNELQDLANKALIQERVIARLNTTGIVPKGLGLTDLDLAGNKFFKSLIRNQKPQNIVNLIYQPGNTKNIKRVYGSLRTAGKVQKIQDLKAAFLENLMEVDPTTNIFNPQTLIPKLDRLGDETLRAAFSPAELSAFKDIANVSRIIEPESVVQGGVSIIREFFEAPGAGLAWLYLKADGRNLIKKAIKQSVRGVTAQQRNAALAKMTAFALREANNARIRNLKPEQQPTPALQPVLSR